MHNSIDQSCGYCSKCLDALTRWDSGLLCASCVEACMVCKSTIGPADLLEQGPYDAGLCKTCCDAAELASGLWPGS